MNIYTKFSLIFLTLVGVGIVIFFQAKQGEKIVHDIQEIELEGDQLFNEIKNSIEKKGVITVWIEFRDKYKNIFPIKHDLAHFLGSELYVRGGWESINYCDSSFTFGCYHGFLESYIKERGIGKINNVVEYCNQKDHEIEKSQCIHGIGHALLSYHKLDLHKALLECENKITYQKYLKDCYLGEFMEFAWAFFHNDKSPLWPCNTLKDKYLEYCYFYQSIYLFSKYPDNYGKSFEMCRSITHLLGRKSCFEGLGVAIGYTNSNTPQQIKLICESAKGNEVSNCLLAAASEFRFNGKSKKEVKQICDFLSLNSRGKCYLQLGIDENDKN